MSARVSGYDSECDLVQDLVRFLGGRRGSAEWRADGIAREFFYARGRTDVIAVRDGELLAFEAKLTRWRDALHQAYRNRCFANRSYVVVPSAIGARLLRHEVEFTRRKVGLCAVSSSREVTVLIESDASEPWQEWLAHQALAVLDGGKGCRRNRTSKALLA
jgi:hypothetical protein